MKTINGKQYYQESDLPGLMTEILNARHMWTRCCSKYMRNHGDVGSCVIGAGISVPYVPKGCRKPRSRMIISSSQVTGAQGSLVWEESVAGILQYLHEHGVPGAFYNPGRMD